MRNLVLSSALLLLGACESKTSPASQQSNATVKTTAQTPETDGVSHAEKAENSAGSPVAQPELPPGHPPTGSAAQGGAAQGGAAQAAPKSVADLPPPSAGGLTWDAPAPLERRVPKSSMRVAEYGIAGSPQSELTVFYFGADQGGSVDANITRWVGQFTAPGGGEVKSKRSEKKVKDIDVSLVEASGNYGGGMAMPGGPAPSEQSDAMLLGAIAKGPQGSVFFKLIGPKKDVEGARKAFDGLVGSLRPEGAAAK